ncbi:hypothetical protein GCM10009000_112480 [Halobacterium noricense]
MDRWSSEIGTSQGDLDAATYDDVREEINFTRTTSNLLVASPSTYCQTAKTAVSAEGTRPSLQAEQAECLGA